MIVPIKSFNSSSSPVNSIVKNSLSIGEINLTILF